MLFSVPAEKYKIDAIIAKAMDKILFFMLIMNKMPQRLQSEFQGRQVPTHLRVLQQELHLYGDQLMVEQMKQF